MRPFPAAALAAALLSCCASAQCGAATLDYRFVPPQVGDTVTYLYQAHSTAGTEAREYVTLARTSAEQVTVALTPEIGQPVAFLETVESDGLLVPTTTSAVTPFPDLPGASPSPAPTRQPGRRGYGREPQPQPSSEPRVNYAPPELPRQVLEIASLVVVASGPGASQRTWTFAATPGSPPVTLNLTRNVSGGDTLFVADGGGYGSAVHLEAIFRRGIFVGARGTERTVIYGVDPSQQPTTTWSLVAFLKP